MIRPTRCYLILEDLSKTWGSDFEGNKWEVVASPEGLHFREQMKNLGDRLEILQYDTASVGPGSYRITPKYHLMRHVQVCARIDKQDRPILFTRNPAGGPSLAGIFP